MFPDFSDFGDVSNDTRMFWENEFSLREKYARYFDGAVFKETIDLEQPVDGEEVLMYPVGLNLVKMLCLAHADGLFGEWSDSIVSFEAKRDDVTDDAALNAIEILNDIVLNSNGNSVLWEAALDREIYGGAVFKVVPVLSGNGGVKWNRLFIQGFFPVFDPDDPDELLEVYLYIPMTREQARLKYGYQGDELIPIRVEHWTKASYENSIGNMRIEAYSGSNPWGIIPFVFIPRMRTRSYFGDSLTEDIIPLQNELNMRVADVSEAINYNAHPIRWGFNLPSKFNNENFPLGANAFWDLGRTLGANLPPTVGIMEPKNAVDPVAFEYIRFVYDWARTSASSPPIIFGEDNGGGQRSGSTLELRMWSYVKSIRRSRSYMINGIRRMAIMSAKIMKQKKFPGISVRALDKIINGEVLPVLSDIMPRDHQAIVDEVVKLMSLTVPSISLETAVKKLDYGASEVERIKAMKKDKDLYPDPPVMENGDPSDKSNDALEAQAGKNQPQTKKVSE
jgi:hypothetical protein